MKRARWIPGALLVGALAVAAAACNSITGLNDYEKVDCVGACGDAGVDAVPEGSPDVINDVPHDDVLDGNGGWDADASLEAGADADADLDAPEDAPDDVTFDASEVGPVDRAIRWARWPMPHADIPLVPDSGNPPGPTESEGYLQVGNYFRDPVTQVLWTHTHSEQVTFGGAAGYCKDLVELPLKARLPSRIELVSLLEPTLTPPHSTELSEVELGEYWTLSDAPNRDQTPAIEYWVVDFNTGDVRTVSDDGAKKAWVRCVVE